MSAITGIEWTDATWNPVRGCSRVSEGCRNCYAEKVAARFSEPGLAYHGFAERSPARWTGKVALVEKHLLDPLRWRKPLRIFVNSMSDLFHESLPDEDIDRVFAVMALAPRHTFQILTKRPERMRAYFDSPIRNDLVRLRAWKMVRDECALGVMIARDDGVGGLAEHNVHRSPWPLPNVWLGVSTEDQERFDERVEILAAVPAAVRFVSMEPLLEQIDMGNALDDPPDGSPLGRIDWVIVGGESGKQARRCRLRWVYEVVKQCRFAGVPVFVKQLGGNLEDDDLSYCSTHSGKSMHHPKGGDPTEWPEDLRVREFPGGAS